MNCQGNEATVRSTRRRCQFSLRTLLLAVTVIAVLGWPLNRYREHARAVAAIRALGGIVDATPVGPKWVRELVGEDGIARVYAVQLLPNEETWSRKYFVEQGRPFYSGPPPSTDQRDPNDNDLRLLNALPETKHLDLGYTEIGDAGARHLKGLTKLTFLNLSYTNVTDRGIECLKELRNLDTLLLYGTQITDAGVVHLKELPQLRVLMLGNTRLSDRGLVHLRSLTNLEDL